ncbi:MAG: LIM domain-containing protein [Bacillota bacterium]|jgi:hypothetical protein
MSCIYHPSAPEVEHCHSCRQPICSSCTVSVNGQIYCRSCATSALGKSSQSTEASWVQLEPGQSKSRGLALLLSIIPGGGYMYLGLMNRGLQTLLIFVGTIFLSEVLNLDFLNGLVIPVLMLYTIFDTQQIAGDLNRTGRILDRGFFEWKSIGLKNPMTQNPGPDASRSAGPFSSTVQPGTATGTSGFNVGGSSAQNDSDRIDPGVSNQYPAGEASSSAWTTGDEKASVSGEVELTISDPVASDIRQPVPPEMPLTSQTNPQTKRYSAIVAYILIGAGALLLLNNLFPSLLVEKYIRMLGGPIVLIGLGLLILYRTRSPRKEVLDQDE